MKTTAFFLLVMSLGLLGRASFADVARGEKLYSSCVACHGSMGEGKKSQLAPRLAGQYDWYVEAQIEAMKSGKRKNPKMLPFIKSLSPQDIKDLALYIQEKLGKAK